MSQEELKIPEDRVAVLIGKKGSEKELIEKTTNTKLDISSDGDIIIKGEDNLKVFLTKNIVKAIGRGVNPDIALKLLKENYYLEIVNIQDFAGKSKKNQLRLKARVIGTKGKARHHIEKVTNTDICVYGKTVCIIGNAEDCHLAKRAVEMLLNGAPHSNVYLWLGKQKASKL